MAPFRLLTRWLLTLIAVGLALVALLLVVVRLSLGQVDHLQQRLVDLVDLRFRADASIGYLDGSLEGVDPRLALNDLKLSVGTGAEEQPLIEVRHGEVRLDTSASLAQGVPVAENLHLSGVTLHLYQDDEQRWRWPDPARIPPELMPQSTFSLERIDFWVGVLLQQRGWVDDLKLVLHRDDGTTVINAPRLLIASDDANTHVEGEVFIEGLDGEAIQVAMSLAPGQEGDKSFSAALQGRMQLDSLEVLSQLLGIDHVVSLDEASGQAEIWGRWEEGRLADARMNINAPILVLNQQARLQVQEEGSSGATGTDTVTGQDASEATEEVELPPEGIVFTNAQLRAQWLRRGAKDWEAWVEGHSEHVEWTGSDGQEAPEGKPVPRHWHIMSRSDGWWANASGFELAALAQWRERVRLPEGLERAVDALKPRGQVTGLGFGRLEGEWKARVAATQVEVDPWESAPGGGPLNIWVEAEGTRGHVDFVDSGAAQMSFPEIFPEPLALDYAKGQVGWSYDGPRTFVSGRNLRVGWRDANVDGNFGLALAEDQRGGFGLTLQLHDVDAVKHPLADWLPLTLLRQKVSGELTDWLTSGLAGRVPEGSLRIHVPLREQGALSGAKLDPRLELNLDVVDGRLPYAEGWPALTNVSGRLSLEDENLEADVAHAESHGVKVKDAKVNLADGILHVDGPLSASLDDTLSFLAAMPVDGAEVAESWRAEGNMNGTLALRLPMDDIDALELTVDSQAQASKVEHLLTGLSIDDVSGPLKWQQRGEDGGMEGRLQGRMLGGQVRAEMDGGDVIDFSGRSDASELSAWGGLPAGSLISGIFPWQGKFDIEQRQLTIDSALEGLDIALPAPLGKSANASRAFHLDVALRDSGTQLSGVLGNQVGMRWRELEGQGTQRSQGQIWVGRSVPQAWPSVPGWSVLASLPRLDLSAWSDALKPVLSGVDASAGGGMPSVNRLHADTQCLSAGTHCLGSLSLDAEPHGRNWQVTLDGSLLTGRVDYQQGVLQPLDIHLQRLSLDDLMAEASTSERAPVSGSVGSVYSELDLGVDPEPYAHRLGDLPPGKLVIDNIERQGKTFGPFVGEWRASNERLSLEPLSLELGELTARGSMIWEASGSSDSLTRSRLAIDGGDPGTALEALGQAEAVRSKKLRVDSQLAWPGAPWQFALANSRGNLSVDLQDGSFVNINAPSAKVIGLLNVDNLLRRLRLDFSDVTRSGTAFDSVKGAATLYGGVLETQGPIKINGPATDFTLEGNADLAQRKLDLSLGVTVPVSNNLPLAAVVAGAPLVGGALYVADMILGDVIDRVTRIHYQVQGPWTAPQISLESAQ
uniref:YhdP family phospholipid transporter n=1 Tax=Halomonas sp. TaxID=1486246 RepID=UPI002638ABA5|nr:AsmA-like C-terminal region-containing protein [Halomonas sp.]